MATDQTYSRSFYNQIAEGCRSSAEVFVPLFLNGRRIQTVIDVGCGQGWWGAEFIKHGCGVTGLDGAYVPDCQLDAFIEHDLLEPLPELGPYDLVVCLEVAEHLPEERAASFVGELCSLGSTVLFSAAAPHQTGAGHINCQWPSWWAVLFGRYGFHLDGSWRWPIWDDDRVEPWYRQNLMVATQFPGTIGPLDVIHPVIHGWGR